MQSVIEPEEIYTTTSRCNTEVHVCFRFRHMNIFTLETNT